MAITGTGTELDPYIVHNYDELKTACEYENYDSSTSTYGTNYVKLANDIDCNDYGADWEWETIELGSTSYSTGHTKHYGSLDLDGHTIKNVYIKTGSNKYMFVGTSASGNTIGSISNGKILNVFLKSSQGFFSRIIFTNVSFSGNFDSILANYAFDSCYLYNSAFYAESNNMGGSGKALFGGGHTEVDNSDIEFHINNCTNVGVVGFNRPANSICNISNSRITGDITGVGTITNNSARTITNVVPVNCVFEIDINGYEKGENLTDAAVLQNSPTCVINDALILPWMTVGTTIKASSSEAMRSASALNTLGFTVVPRE